MASTIATPKTDRSHLSTNESEKDIANHKKAAEHLKKAAEHHLDAARHHEKGNHEKASESTVKAHGHSHMANECQKEDTKHHALNGEQKK